MGMDSLSEQTPHVDRMPRLAEVPQEVIFGIGTGAGTGTGTGT